MFALLFITTLLPSFALASVDCSWDYESQLVTCNNHKYYDRITKKLLPITYHTSPFTRPLAEIKNDADHYSHDDKRHDNNGTASFDYFFNIGRNVNQGAATIPADCKETTGADGKTSSGPSIAYQQDENRDFKCHRIAGDVSKKENVAVGPIRDDDPTVGFYMTVKGGDDCSDSWRGNSGGYTGRSLTIRFFCDTSADAVAKLPDVETMREDLTCMCKCLTVLLGLCHVFFLFLTFPNIVICIFFFFFLLSPYFSLLLPFSPFFLFFFTLLQMFWMCIPPMDVHCNVPASKGFPAVNMVPRAMVQLANVFLAQQILNHWLKGIQGNLHVSATKLKDGLVQNVIKSVQEQQLEKHPV